jgi:pimeloyl-ACP methyl ester carboxylesterase
MPSTISKDGTVIAYDKIGSGPPVILVDGALCYRGMGESAQLASLLAPRFTVLTYDRRGRGQSGNSLPYAVEREVEDIAALLCEAGGTAFLWGMSSGAVLALEAANCLSGVRKLALYEAPLIVDRSRATTGDDWARIDEAIAKDRRSDALKIFLRSVGLPRLLAAVMPLTPFWRKLTAIAHTLPYDGVIVREFQRGKSLPADRWESVTVPVLVMDGGKSPEWMRLGNKALAGALSDAHYQTLPGQTHMLKPKAHAPALVAFFEQTKISCEEGINANSKRNYQGG